MSAPAGCRLPASLPAPLHPRSEIAEPERQRCRKLVARFCLDMARAPAPPHRETAAEEGAAPPPAHALPRAA
jgi:hypothetical protein